MLPLTDQEIVALIANILDLLMEACQKVEEGKWIEIIIRQIKDVSFEEKHMKDDREVLRKWFLQNAYKEYIIINITGNRGGTDYYWMDLIVAPNIESKMGYISYLITPYGEETREQFALCGIKDGDLKVIDENILELPEVNREDLEGAGFINKNIYIFLHHARRKVVVDNFLY